MCCSVLFEFCLLHSPPSFFDLLIHHGLQLAVFGQQRFNSVVKFGDFFEQDIAVSDRLAEVDARIKELQAMRRHLRSLAERADAQDPADCEGYCSIITGDSSMTEVAAGKAGA